MRRKEKQAQTVALLGPPGRPTHPRQELIAPESLETRLGADHEPRILVGALHPYLEVTAAPKISTQTQTSASSHHECRERVHDTPIGENCPFSGSPGTEFEDNVRDEVELDKEFLASLREHGVIVPIIAVRDAEGRTLVREGQCRTLGAREVGLTSVPVYVIPAEPPTTTPRRSSGSSSRWSPTTGART